MTRSRTTRHARGFTLIEAVICILLIGITLVAALRTVGASARTQVITQRRSIGGMLAQDLMAEVLSKAYTDPDGQVSMTDVGDTPGNRTTYDDVDDYDGWSQSPPKDAAGNALTDYTGWTRTVSVDPVLPTAPDTVSGSDTGVLRVTVQVYRGDLLAAELQALKTQAWTFGEAAP